MNAKKTIVNLLAQAGVKVGGGKPWDIQVNDPRFYRRIITFSSLGLGEAYMDGWWNAPRLEEFFSKMLRADLRRKILNWRIILSIGFRTLRTIATDFGNRKNSQNIGAHHYDVGNDIYKAMLDKRLVYTCGYWNKAQNLDEAQEAKLDLVCRKLNLKPGMKVLDIGCGWGSFLKFAAEKYGIEGVGVTVSKNQKELGDELCKGLPIEIKLQDYRETEGKFDAIVSLGMFEHVGPKHYKTFMKKARSLLKSDGLFLLHVIGSHKSRQVTDPWIDKYIFPGGVIPSLHQMSKALQEQFIMEDWHNFGHDYYKTLMAWHKNFITAWSKLYSPEKYNTRFRRMWEYYILSCAGAFKSRYIQLWQMVLSPNGVDGGYVSVR